MSRRRRILWWLPPWVIAGGALMSAVGYLLGADYPGAFVMFCLAAIVVVDRTRERLAFKRGWERGYSDALHEIRARATGDGNIPASVMRWLVHGHPAPEPWDRHPADEDPKEKTE